MVRLSGRTTAPPRPCTVRAAISAETSGATAQAAEATVNRARPMVKTRRRPKRSPRAAAVMMPAAKAMLYAVSVHWSDARPACRSRCTRGSAVATTTESRTTMKYAVDVRPRTQPRWVLARVFVTITPQGATVRAAGDAPVRAAGDVDTGPPPELAPPSFRPGRCPYWQER